MNYVIYGEEGYQVKNAVNAAIQKEIGKRDEMNTVVYSALETSCEEILADAQTIRISKQLQVKEVALCAYRLSFFHPESGRRMDFRIRPEGKSFQAEEFVPYYDNDEN